MSKLGPEVRMMISILDRFAEWARYFGIKTCIASVKREIKHLYNDGLMPTTAYSVWSES